MNAFDERVLRAVAQLGADAYGVPIYEAVTPMLGWSTSFGAIYAALDRLEAAGLVTSRDSAPLPERGGRRKRYWALTIGGAAALRGEG